MQSEHLHEEIIPYYKWNQKTFFLQMKIWKYYIFNF